MTRVSFNEGDEVFAIVKNIANFRLEVVSATVSKIREGKVSLGRPTTPFETSVYTFPEDECEHNVFNSFEEAENELMLRMKPKW